jgi:hypothetical protein
MLYLDFSSSKPSRLFGIPVALLGANQEDAGLFLTEASIALPISTIHLLSDKFGAVDYN